MEIRRHSVIRITPLLLAALFVSSLSSCSWLKKDEDESLTMSAAALYARATEELADENWSEAIDWLQKLEARHPYGNYAKQAQLDTVYAQYKADRAGLAIAAADRYIALHPTDDSVDYALYLKGLASFNERHDLIGVLTGRTNLAERDPQAIHDAVEAFTTLVTRFPESRYTRDAKSRIHYMNTALAAREISIARYYYAREAYLAAVNRSKYVLENYTQSISVEDALGIMVHAYAKMNLDELSEDSRRVLETNYPDSAYLKGVSEGESTWLTRLKARF